MWRQSSQPRATEACDALAPQSTAFRVVEKETGKRLSNDERATMAKLSTHETLRLYVQELMTNSKSIEACRAVATDLKERFNATLKKLPAHFQKEAERAAKKEAREIFNERRGEIMKGKG